MKIKIVLATILAVGTLLGFSALVSAVHNADHGTAHSSMQNWEPMQRAA
ncbi:MULTISPECIES: hypothetical protein [unclassified Nitrobacter]|jgi:hypothetical protein|nr:MULTISPECIES: hypothetical protein [unclassified Nitrobacter]MBN9147205.1 hypothetical protein [Nitrobacter sp.]